MEYKRNCGIDLLRLVLMFMVCILHVLGQGGILEKSISNNLNNSIFWALETFCFCAVDSFAFITGYTANNKQKKHNKIIDIWFQLFFYSFVVTLLLYIFGVGKNFEVKELIKCAFPITFNKYWYMTAYFVLFFTMPIINKYIFELKEENAKIIFVFSIILFSVIGLVIDSFKTNLGYSPLWIIILYFLGALAKKIRLFENKKSIYLICIWFLCLFISWIIHIIFGIERFITYISPTILFSGIIMVILFSRIKIKEKYISQLYPLALGVYLFQLNPIIWNYIDNYFAYIANKNIFIGLVLCFASSLILFTIGIIVEFVRRIIFKKLKISILSERLIKVINKLLKIADNLLE